MADEDGASAVESEARSLLDAIGDARAALEGLPGLLDGDLDRFRDRIDRILRESEVDNWRQVRIFLRDLDAIAADLAKAAKEKRLPPKQLHVLDLTLRRARKRDFYGARKAWRKLDKVAHQIGEVRRLQGEYRELYRGTEARIRDLRAEAERLARVPKPSASAADAAALVAAVDDFNDAAGVAYLDFLARAPARVSIPLLLEVSQGGGVGIPAPPHGSDPEPLLNLLNDADPARDPIRTRSFYALLELPSYSDAKLTHVMGDARLVRRALDSAWAWLKAIREDERRSLRIQWTDDVAVLKPRVAALLVFLARTNPPNDAIARGEALQKTLEAGRFAELQVASKVYASYGSDAERRWRGELDGVIKDMGAEAARLAAVVKRLPDPARVEAGDYP